MSLEDVRIFTILGVNFSVTCNSFIPLISVEKVISYGLQLDFLTVEVPEQGPQLMPVFSSKSAKHDPSKSWRNQAYASPPPSQD